MNEWDWLSRDDPAALLESHPSPTERKLRLFGVACCYQNWDILDYPQIRDAVVIAERFADGRATESQRAKAESGVWEVERVGDCDWHIDAALYAIYPDYPRTSAVACTWQLADSSGYYAANETGFQGMREELLIEQAFFVRDIFGNPFRPVRVDPAWLTSTVAALANGIYEERAFDRLPILADALMDAGCDHPDVLTHCRSDGPHVRGCWVVDLLLGKA